MISRLGTSFKKHNTSHFLLMRAMKQPLLVPRRSGKQPACPLLRFSRCFAVHYTFKAQMLTEIRDLGFGSGGQNTQEARGF